MLLGLKEIWIWISSAYKGWSTFQNVEIIVLKENINDLNSRKDNTERGQAKMFQVARCGYLQLRHTRGCSVLGYTLCMPKRKSPLLNIKTIFEKILHFANVLQSTDTGGAICRLQNESKMQNNFQRRADLCVSPTKQYQWVSLITLYPWASPL